MKKNIGIRIFKFKYLALAFFAILADNQYIQFNEAKTPVSFEKVKIKAGNQDVIIELAKTDIQLKRGLMNRAQLKENEGMLFIFDKEKTLSFWMKNTLFDLSIAYINSNYEIVDIQEMTVVNENQENLIMYSSKLPARYALEMNKGWFQRNNINIGNKIELKF